VLVSVGSDRAKGEAMVVESSFSCGRPVRPRREAASTHSAYGKPAAQAVPLFWIMTVFLLVRFVFWRRGPWGGRRGPDPRAILAERYARGEITHDEYRERLGHLEGV